MRYQQKGSVLIISLLLLLIATLISVAGISNMQTNEKIASNQKQASEAFIAAESGLIQVKSFLDNDANAPLWGKPIDVKNAVNALDRNLPNNLQWSVDTVDFTTQPGLVRLVIAGTVTTTGVVRRVQAFYRPKAASSNLAAMNVIGNIKSFTAKNSNSFSMVGEKDENGNIVGPALATNTTENLNKINSSLGSNIKANIQAGGGIKEVKFADPFGSPEKMYEFIQSIKEQYRAMDFEDGKMDGKSPNSKYGFPPDKMGTTSIPRITYYGYWDQYGGAYDAAKDADTRLKSNLEIGGNDLGAGILVVDGNLTIKGSLDFDGLIIVTGQSVLFKGLGSSKMKGSIVFANPINTGTTAEPKWSFGEAEATFEFDLDGGGNADIRYDKNSLLKAHTLLKQDSAAAQMWKVKSSAEATATAAPSAMLQWSEVVN